MFKLAGTVDKGAYEKAFMDQAYGLVANRCSELFHDPYRLGFEIVYDSGDEHNRMVGLFAFRLGKRLLYAPVFFINGNIKGHDLLYRHWVKRFCPSTPEWVQYLVESTENEVGKPIDKSDAGQMRSTINFNTIAGPPQYKMASSDAKAGWSALLYDMAAQLPEPSDVLADFMRKHAADGTFDLLSKLIDSSSVFAEALSTLPESSWNPDLPVVKRASAPVDDTPELFTRAPADSTPEEAGEFYRRGYLLREKRAAERIDADISEIPYAQTGIPGSGKFKMLMPGGEWREVIVGTVPQDDFNGMRGTTLHHMVLNVGGIQQREHHAMREVPIVVIDVKSGDSKEVEKPSECCVDETDAVNTLRGLGQEKPAAGNAYRMLDPTDGTIGTPFFVHSVKTRDGVTVCVCNHNYSREGEHGDFILRINPDAEYTVRADNLACASARFVKVTYKKHQSDSPYLSYVGDKAIPGNRRDFDRWVMRQAGVRKITLSADPALTKVAFDGTYVDGSRSDIHRFLAGLGLSVKTAGELLDKTTMTPRDYYVIKKGYATQQAARENFPVFSSSTFGVSMESPQTAHLNTFTPRIRNAEPKVGDAWDPSMGAGGGRKTVDGIPESVILRSSPEELASIAKTHKMPNVFEHGILGSMTKTFDAISMLESYIPALDACVDRLGRALFLFYFKPKDFEEAYGADDMQSQENNFLNALRTIGDLLLDLLRRSRANGKSGVPEQGSAVEMLT